MPTTTLFYTGLLNSVRCCKCGVTFGLDSGHEQNLRKTHDEFYCPNGHKQYFAGQTEEERLARELRAMEQSRDYYSEKAEQTALSNRSLRGVITRTKRRVGHGVCPCCSRTFKQLAAHMQTKHPNYVMGSPDVKE